MPSSALTLNDQPFSAFNFTWSAGFGPGTYNLIEAGSINGTLGTSTTGTIDGLPATLAVEGNDALVLTVTPKAFHPRPAERRPVGLAGYGLRQRRRRRSLYPHGGPTLCGEDEADSQEHGPAILTLPSCGRKHRSRQAA